MCLAFAACGRCRFFFILIDSRPPRQIRGGGVIILINLIEILTPSPASLDAGFGNWAVSKSSIVGFKK